MQFEPRLFSPEAAPANAAAPNLTADLPAELAVIADQLQADAGRLADRYAPLARPRNSGRRWAWAAAVAALSFSAGVAGGGWSVSRSTPEQRTADAGAPARNRATGTTDPAPAGDLVIVRQEEPALERDAKTAPAATFVGAGPRALPRPNRMPARDEAALLRRQVAAFELVIERLQAEVRERADQQSQTDAVVAELRREIDELRRRLEAAH